MMRGLNLEVRGKVSVVWQRGWLKMDWRRGVRLGVRDEVGIGEGPLWRPGWAQLAAQVDSEATAHAILGLL